MRERQVSSTLGRFDENIGSSCVSTGLPHLVIDITCEDNPWHETPLRIMAHFLKHRYPSSSFHHVIHNNRMRQIVYAGGPNMTNGSRHVTNPLQGKPWVHLLTGLGEKGDIHGIVIDEQER